MNVTIYREGSKGEDIVCSINYRGKTFKGTSNLNATSEQAHLAAERRAIYRAFSEVQGLFAQQDKY